MRKALGQRMALLRPDLLYRVFAGFAAKDGRLMAERRCLLVGAAPQGVFSAGWRKLR